MPELNKISFKAFPALNGDCFLVTYNDHNEEKNILIDGGYADTYKEYLQRELHELSLRNGRLDLFVITHIDADHLTGAISFLKDNSEPFISIGQIWHNTFRHIQPMLTTKPSASSDFHQPALQQLLRRGYPSRKVSSGEISAQQGTTVGALILKNNIGWNTDFGEKAVSKDNLQSIKFGIEGSIFLLSPGNSELNNLTRFWEQELRKYDLKFNSANSSFYDDAFEMMLSWEKSSGRQAKAISAVNATPATLLNRVFKEDSGVTNGSSIAFILTIHQKKLLLLGDAHPKVVERELTNYQKEGLILFDLIKMSHHGSFNNISPELLRRTDSPRYVFSANGTHGHPEKETIAHIICRKGDFLRTLYFNYKTENSEFFNREDWKVAYNYQVSYLSTTNYTLTF